MANVFARIEKYLQSAVDTVFAEDSKTRILENGSKFIDVNFKEAGYVKVMSLLMDGLSDYYRVNSGSVGTDYTHYQDGKADGYQKGNAEGSWELFKLTYDRGKQFQVDSMDDEETAGLVIGNLLTEFLRTKVVPEVDAVRFSKMAKTCSATLGNLVTAQTIADNEIIKAFNTAFEWLSEHEVPSEEQVIFVNPSIMTKIRNTTELYKKLSQVEYRGDVTFKIETYEGRPIIEVPSSRFFTDVVCGSNGFHATEDSKVINFMVVSKRAIVPIVKLQKSKIWTPEQVQDFDGYKINFRMYHDVIIPKNKIAGVYVSVGNTAATTKSNLLSVAISKSGSNYVLDQYFTTPAGIYGAKIVRKATAMAIGSDETSNNNAVIVGTPFGKLNSEDGCYFALLDANNKVVATSAKVTYPA